MAGNIWDEVYDFLAAPARERKARDEFKQSIQPVTFDDVQKFKPDDRLSAQPAGLTINANPFIKTGSKTGSEVFGPPTPENLANSMDLAAMNPPAATPAAAPVSSSGGYAPWGTYARSLFFNAMNGGDVVDPRIPRDSGRPVNLPPVSGAGGSSSPAIMADAMTLTSVPKFSGVSAGYNYANGKRTAPVDRYSGMSPGAVYDAVNRDAANAARARVGKEPLRESSGSSSDYSTHGNSFFSSGF